MTEIATSDLDGDRVVITAPGRLNMVAAPRLREAIAAAVDDRRRLVVVDLGQTEFMDSSGLGALVAGLKSARRTGGDLRIARPTEQVQTVLRLTNMDRVLRPHPSVEAALDAA